MTTPDKKLPVALYELTGEYLQALERLTDLDVPEEAIKDTLEGLQGELKDKMAAVNMMARNFEALAMQIKIAENNMAARRQALDKRAVKLREYLLENMQKAQITKIEHPYFTMTVKKNPPAVIVFDSAAIPEAYLRMPPVPLPEPDKTLIKADLVAGKDVPGCRLEQKERLEVK